MTSKTKSIFVLCQPFFLRPRRGFEKVSTAHSTSGGRMRLVSLVSCLFLISWRNICGMSFFRDQSACFSPRKKMNLFFVCSLMIVSVTNACEYDLLHSNGSVHRCVSDQCDQSVDPSSLKIVDRLCRTSFLALSFSTYGHVRLFLTELSYPLSELFLRQSSVLRIFRLFVHRLNDADQPLAYEEVIRWGTQIDLYQLFILHLPRSFSHPHSVDLHPAYPQWSLIQMKMLFVALQRRCLMNNRLFLLVNVILGQRSIAIHVLLEFFLRNEGSPLKILQTLPAWTIGIVVGIWHGCGFLFPWLLFFRFCSLC